MSRESIFDNDVAVEIRKELLNLMEKFDAVNPGDPSFNEDLNEMTEQIFNMREAVKEFKKAGFEKYGDYLDYVLIRDGDDPEDIGGVSQVVIDRCKAEGIL